MKQIIKKSIAALLSFALITTAEVITSEKARAEAADPAGQNFLTQIKGDYQPLFEGATFDQKYDHYWHDYAAAVVGESQANDTVAYLKASIGSTGYGSNAVPPNFYCGFIDDVASISFGEDGKTVTYKKNDGTTVSHEYEYVKEAAAKGMYGEYEMEMEGHLYKAKDDNDDGFEYLLMFPDTPDTTYHLEFRYADTEANVLSLTSGEYGYWVGSAIKSSALSEANEATLQNVISLFVVENLADMTNEETNKQRAGLVGTWDCDFSAFPEYAGAQMYIVLGADGSGKTYADFTGKAAPSLTAEYTFFAYDENATDGKDAGTYISLNEEAGTVTPGRYEIGTVNGKKALIFTSNEGTITYLYRETASEPGSDTEAAKAQTITVKTASKTYKAKALKKKSKSFNIGAKAETSLTYKVTKYPKNAKKYIKVSKKGKVTLKKNAKKGTYKITVTAKATAAYKQATKTVTVKVK